MTREDGEYPLQGVRLSALKSYVKAACEQNGLDLTALTTAEFCSKLVVGVTTKTSKDALVNHFDQAKDVRKVATIFVSHAWTGLIMETISAVEEQSGIPAEEQFVWLDCCSVNQHEVQSKPAEWYSSTFHQAIQTVGFTCLVLTPIMSPTPLKRSWCLWELFGTINTKTKLRICVPSSQKQVLIDLMQRDFIQIMNNICSVDAAKAEAFFKQDQERIREAIDSTVGIERINEAALDPLREWLLETATEATHTKSDPELLRGLGVLRYDLGRIDQAIEAFERSLELRRNTLKGTPSSDQTKKREVQLSIAGDLTNLGACKFEKGLANDALALYSESLDMRITLEETRDLSLAYNNKALALKSLRRYDEAFECFDQGLKAADQAGNPQARENTLMNRAELSREVGNASEAAQVLRQVLESKQAKLGREHVSVAQVMNLLGQSLMDLKEFDEAETMFNNALRIRSRALGKSHPRVGLCVANLAKLDTLRGNIPSAKKRYQDLIALQTEAFGADHRFVKESQKMMDELLNGARKPRPTVEDDLDSDPLIMSNVFFGMALPRAPAQEAPFQFSQAYTGMEAPRQRIGRETSAMQMIPPRHGNGDEDTESSWRSLGRELSAVEMVLPDHQRGSRGSESPSNSSPRSSVLNSPSRASESKPISITPLKIELPSTSSLPSSVLIPPPPVVVSKPKSEETAIVKHPKDNRNAKRRLQQRMFCIIM